MRKILKYIIVTNVCLVVFYILYGMCDKTYSDYPYEQMQVVCVPVYGQSYALGEESVRITDFDSLSAQFAHRVVTQDLDEEFGYFDNSSLRQVLKRLVHYRKRSFELVCYGMAEEFLQQIDNDSIIFCTFPGGRGTTSIVSLMPGSEDYNKFLDEIRGAVEKAKRKGWNFVLPAYCWLQGENDIAWQTSKDYYHDLMTWHTQFCEDVCALTGQKKAPICICYQSNCIARTELDFSDSSFCRPEVYVPNAQIRLIRERDDFMFSGPTYPYNVVGERIHLDGIGMKRLAHLTGLTLSRCWMGENSDGLYVKNNATTVSDSTIELSLHVSYPPLVLDTLEVRDPGHYGFTVISCDNRNLLRSVEIKDSTVLLRCSKLPKKYKIRYAVNGIHGKAGRLNGSRGCLRDSQGQQFTCLINGKSYPMDNWCGQFEIQINE